MSQSTSSSVSDLLPDNCCLNVDDEDFDVLEQINNVEDSYFNINRLTEVEVEGSGWSGSKPDSDSTSDSEPGAEITESGMFEYRTEDQFDITNTSHFFESSCHCKLHEGGPCSRSLERSCLQAYRLNMMELSTENVDLIVLSHMQQNRLSKFNQPKTLKTYHHTSERDRKKSYMKYTLFGKTVCRKTYLFAHAIGRKRYESLCRHYDANGVTPRVHKNSLKIPYNACSVEFENNIVTFIKNYANKYAMPLPGRMPRMRDFTVMMLPSDTTKVGMWNKYVAECASSDITHVKLTKFKDVWSQYLPDICVMKTASDLCDVCQRNNSLIMKSANTSDEEKSARLKQQEEHLSKSKECRQYYRDQCNEASNYWNNLTLEQKKGDFIEGPTHISFDYAQNVQVPHQPQQVGPIFFKTPRKVHLFGICCEQIPKQINDLIDEHDFTGKGANETVSYLDHYFKYHAIKSKTVNLHCDNCRRQNKNNALMQYLLLRTLLGLNDKIECSFMIPYHTKFAPDWCFGLIKLKYKRSYVSSVTDLAEVVKRSTQREINQPQHIQDPGTHATHVTVRKWKPYLEHLFRKIPKLTDYHHFRFSRDSPGVVFVRELPSKPEKRISLVKDGIPLGDMSTLPEVVIPFGLTPERAWYLYDQIRCHCEDSAQDETCPKPTIPRPKLKKKLSAGESKIENQC